jgi:hypothetical protein
MNSVCSCWCVRAGARVTQAIDPVNMWGKAVERVRRVPEEGMGDEGMREGKTGRCSATVDGLKRKREHQPAQKGGGKALNACDSEGGGKQPGKQQEGGHVSKKRGTARVTDEPGRDEDEGDESRQSKDGENASAGRRTVLVHNLLFNYEQPLRELLEGCGTLQSLRFKWLPDFRCYTARVRFNTGRAAQNAVKLSGSLCMGRAAVIELLGEGAGAAAALAPEAMRLKSQYQPPPDGPPMQVTALGRQAPPDSPEHIDLNALNTPRHPDKDLRDDSPLRLAEGFELRKLPRCEVERLLPGWTYTIDNRPGNGSWYVPGSQGYGNFSHYKRHQEVERALLSRMLYPETIKIIVRGDPAVLFGRRSGAPVPDPLVEIGGVSHDQGVLPIHPEACGAGRPVYVGYGDYYSVPSELLMRRFAKLEQDVRQKEQYRGIPRVTAAATGELSYIEPTQLEVIPDTGELKMPFPTGGRGFMDSYVQYAPGP